MEKELLQYLTLLYYLNSAVPNFDLEFDKSKVLDNLQNAPMIYSGSSSALRKLKSYITRAHSAAECKLTQAKDIIA